MKLFLYSLLRKRRKARRDEKPFNCFLSVCVSDSSCFSTSLGVYVVKSLEVGQPSAPEKSNSFVVKEFNVGIVFHGFSFETWMYMCTQMHVIVTMYSPSAVALSVCFLCFPNFWDSTFILMSLFHLSFPCLSLNGYRNATIS